MASADVRDALPCPICTRISTHPELLTCLQIALNESGSPFCPECRKAFEEYQGSSCHNHTRFQSNPERVLSEAEPLQETRTCLLHKKHIESYCLEDAACLCASCTSSGEHVGHRVVSLKKATKSKKKLLHLLQDMTEERDKFPEESLLRLIGKAQEKAIYEEQRVQDLFRVIRRQLEELETTIHGEVSRKKEDLLLLQRTEEREAELSWKMRHMEELCTVTDPLTFVRELDQHGHGFIDAWRKLKNRREDREHLRHLFPPDTGFISPYFSEHLSSVVTDLKEIQMKTPHHSSPRRDVRSITDAADSTRVETVTSTNTKVYRLRLTSTGRHKCSETGIRFKVKGPVILEYSMESWSNHMTDTLRNGYEIVGPLFGITAREGQNNVTAVYLPHYLSPQCCDQYKSYIKCVHFKDNKMILESPTRLDPTFAVLENPTFSCLGALLEKFWTFITRPLTFNGVVLIYGKVDKTYSFRLYTMIDSEPTLKRAIDKQIGKEYHYICKPPQTDSVYVMKKYIVQGPQGAEIEPKFVHFRFTIPSKLYPYVEITLKDIHKKMCLGIAEKSTGNEIWSCSITKEQLDNLRSITTESAKSGRPGQSPTSEAKLFVKKNFKHLCSRLGILSPILLSLRAKDVISEPEEEVITGQRTQLDSNRSLLNMIRKKGAEQEFYEALKENDYPLMEDLEGSLSRLQINQT